MMIDQTLTPRPNPLHPDRMTAHERRTELYGLIATAVVRLIDRDRDDLSQKAVRRRMIWNIRGDFGAEVIGSSGSGYAA